MGNIKVCITSAIIVDEETALVCDQRRRTGGATAVSGLDDDGWCSETCVVLIVIYNISRLDLYTVYY